MQIKSLKKYGWDSFFTEQLINDDLSNKYFPARIVAQHAETYKLISESGNYYAKVTGKFKFTTTQTKDYPVVGDFVFAEKVPQSDQTLIHKVLQRKNFFSRKMPISGGRRLKNGIIDGGVTEEQVIASNIDTVFILCGLDGNFNISRLERYLTLVHHQRLDTVILLNKADLCDNPEAYVSQVRKVANGRPVFVISAVTKTGLDALKPYMTDGKTVVFLGSSGVGKSTLLNALFKNDLQSTRATSDHSGKGKHTTTHRELFLHPSGCLIIDTPGMKELQLWAESDDLDHVFDDVHSLIEQCRFTNCTHRSEPGCAVLAALENGILSQERYFSYQKQYGELNRLGEKQKAYARQLRRQTRRR